MDTYHPESKSPVANLEACFEDFQNGIAQAVAYDEPILLHKINELGIKNVYFMQGTHDIVLSSAWSGRYVNPHRNAFEQGLIVAQGKADHFQQVYDSYFPDVNSDVVLQVEDIR